jgi:hypothetical protein
MGVPVKDMNLLISTISALQKRVEEQSVTINEQNDMIEKEGEQHLGNIARIARLEGALDFYSNPKNYEKQGYEGTINSKVIADNGRIARTAMENKK